MKRGELGRDKASSDALESIAAPCSLWVAAPWSLLAGWGDKRPSTLASPRLGILGLDRRLHLAV